MQVPKLQLHKFHHARLVNLGCPELPDACGPLESLRCEAALSTLGKDFFFVFPDLASSATRPRRLLDEYELPGLRPSQTHTSYLSSVH